MTNIAVHEMASRGARELYKVPPTQRDQVWDTGRKIRCYNTLLMGYPPGLWWAWRTDMRTDYELVLDGMQRLAAVLNLFDISAPTHDGQSAEPPAEKVQFHPAKRVFRIRPRAEAAVPTTENADPLVSARAKGWVDVAPVLNSPDADIRALIRNIANNLGSGEERREQQREALNDLRAIRNVTLPVVTFTGDVAQGIELFISINKGSAPMSREDLTLALISRFAGNWRNTHFAALRKQLKAEGFEVTKRLLLVTFGAIWKGDPSLAPVGKNIEEWSELVQPGSPGAIAWDRTVSAWERTITYLRSHGISSISQLPNTSALIALVALAAKFPASLDSGRALGWIYAGALTARYRSSSTQRVKHDVTAVYCALTADEALDELIFATGYSEQHHITVEQLKSTPTPALRSILWAAVYARQARDWLTGERLTREAALHAHHIFPKQLARQQQIFGVECLANFAYLSAASNESLSDQAPEFSLARPDLVSDTLAEQWVWRDADLRRVDKFAAAMEYRATRMAVDLNKWVESLLVDRAVVAESTNDREIPATPELEPLTMGGRRAPAGSPVWAPGTVLALTSNSRVRVRVGTDGSLVLSPGGPVVTRSRPATPSNVVDAIARLTEENGLGRELGSDRYELVRPVTALSLGSLAYLATGNPAPTAAWRVVSGPGALPGGETEADEAPAA